MIERWKEFARTYHSLGDSKGYYNIWEVSTFGRFKRNGKFVEPHDNSDGYLTMKQKRVHRIVAETFIPNPDNKLCIDHIDGNKLNNRVDNLRWVTHLENNNNPVTKAKLVESQKNSEVFKKTRDGAKNQKWIEGRRWITNGEEELLIFPVDYNLYKNLGYSYGRI